MINQEHYNEPCHRGEERTPEWRAFWQAEENWCVNHRGINPSEPIEGHSAWVSHLGQAQAQADQVYQPAHYARYIIEPATFIGANKLPFDVGNVIKYVCRYDAKNGREDLKKAARYIEMLIERLDREDRVAAGENPQVVWSKML